MGIAHSSSARKVFVALNLSETAGRKILAGILKYVNSGHRWQLTIANDFANLTDDFVQRADASGTDGVIGGLPEVARAFRELLSSDVPFVLNVEPEALPIPVSRIHHTAFVDVDNEAIGKVAAEYFATRGNFASVAFVSDRADRQWSLTRERAFRERWKADGIDIRAFTCESRQRPLDAERLGDFLAQLPKPAAVWCVYDTTAVIVHEICLRRKINIPGQIALLGTDNDEVLCRYTRPSLSSIDISQEDLGYLAAETLDRLMARGGGTRHPDSLLVDSANVRVIERDTTRRIPPAAHLVKQAVAFINSHATEGISAKDVIRHLNVSSSLANLRFQQLQKKSIGRTILDARLQEIKSRLQYSDMPLSRIAEKCAFSSLSRMAHFFKHETGMTLSAYRHLATG